MDVSSPQNVQFRCMLKKVGDLLTLEDVESIVYIHSLRGRRESGEKESALGVLRQLEERGLFSDENVDPLVGLLNSISRSDIANSCAKEYKRKAELMQLRRYSDTIATAVPKQHPLKRLKSWPTNHTQEEGTQHSTSNRPTLSLQTETCDPPLLQSIVEDRESEPVHEGRSMNSLEQSVQEDKTKHLQSLLADEETRTEIIAMLGLQSSAVTQSQQQQASPKAPSTELQRQTRVLSSIVQGTNQLSLSSIDKEASPSQRPRFQRLRSRSDETVHTPSPSSHIVINGQVYVPSDGTHTGHSASCEPHGGQVSQRNISRVTDDPATRFLAMPPPTRTLSHPADLKHLVPTTWRGRKGLSGERGVGSLTFPPEGSVLENGATQHHQRAPGLGGMHDHGELVTTGNGRGGGATNAGWDSTEVPTGIPPSLLLPARLRCKLLKCLKKVPNELIWRLDRRDLFQPIFRHSSKVFSKELQVHISGSKPKRKSLKLYFQLYPNGVGQDKDRNATLDAAVTCKCKELPPMAKLNISVRYLTSEGREFLKRKEFSGQEVKSFTIYNFLPHRVIKTSYDKAWEFHIAVHLSYEMADLPAVVSYDDESDFAVIEVNPA